jgi:hypothetical protein
MDNDTENKTKPGSSTFPAFRFLTEDSELQRTFDWAFAQATAYAFEDAKIGPWYEAALPGREAFCMRDVSHQAMGAHALGLQRHTKNMIMRFAAEVSDERDWCSLWEINRYGMPPFVDYLNDAEFWYCLPANFDLIDCCYRMYLWTGDRDYLTDPVLQDFYQRSVTEYVERWDLGLDRIMSRQRLMNARRDPATASRFVHSRGLPGYDEGDHDYSVSLCLLSALYAGYNAYARLLELGQDTARASIFHERAQSVLELIESTWWDEDRGLFFSIADTGASPRHSERAPGDPLHWRLPLRKEHIAGALEQVRLGTPDEPTWAVEVQAHASEAFYRYGQYSEAYRQLLYLASGSRKEYPEAAFCAVGTMVAGLMGVDVEYHAPHYALRDGGYVDHVVTTRSRLTEATPWAELSHLAVRSNKIGVRHEGGSTTVTNEEGVAFMWRAFFEGHHEKLMVDGKTVPAISTNDELDGREYSNVQVVMGAGESKTVSVL